MKLSTFIFFLAVGHFSIGQTVTYSNFGTPHVLSKYPKDTFYSSKIHEITLKADSTFEFWSRPHLSCATWKSYKGSLKKIGDTLLFLDNYQIEELDTKVTYQKNEESSFQLSFSTDRSSNLKSRIVKVEYVYDYDTKLKNYETTLQLNTSDKIVIPFSDIPNIQELASIRIEYQLTSKEKRYSFLTNNTVVNIKGQTIPNVISVQFIENPKKETVFRTTKGFVSKESLIIVSTNKTESLLPDYYANLEFENNYKLIK